MNFGASLLIKDLLNGPARPAPVQQPPVAAAEVVLPVVEDPAAIQSQAPPAAARPAASPYIDPTRIPEMMAQRPAAPAAAPQPQFAPSAPPASAPVDTTRMDEINGRISTDSRALKLMRMAQMNGQNLPFALAYSMAANSFPTTGPDTSGRPSLPALDPARMAGLGPAAGQVAGQTQIGLGMNDNVSGRNQMDFYNEQGRQRLASEGRGDQTQLMLMELMRRMQNDQHSQRNENRVLDNTLGDPQRQAQKDAEAWMSTPAGMSMRSSYDPQERQFYQARMQQAMGGGAAAAGGAPAQGGAAATPMTADALRKQREALLVADPVAMQQHLSQFGDPIARQREEARLYYENGRTNEPSIFNFLKDILERDNPNLHAGPDWMTTDSNRAAAAAKWASQRYGVPEPVANQHYYNYFDN